MKFKNILALLTFSLIISSPATTYAQEPSEVETSVETEEKTETTTERKLLDYKPDDLIIDFPDSFPLQLQADDSYCYNGVIHLESDNKYFVSISPKDTNVEYINENGDSVIGIIELGDTELDYNEILTGVDIPLVITVPEIASGGEFKASIGFSIDIYQEQAIEAPPVVEEQVIETIELSSEVITASDVEAYPHLKSITITKDVKSIEASAFDSLSELTDIYYLGSEVEWSSVFSGSLDGVVIRFAEETESEVPEVPGNPVDPEVDPTQPTDEPKVEDETSTEDEVTDEQPTEEEATPTEEDIDTSDDTSIDETPESEETEIEEPSSEESKNEEPASEDPSQEQPVNEEPVEEPAPEPVVEEKSEITNDAVVEETE